MRKNWVWCGHLLSNDFSFFLCDIIYFFKGSVTSTDSGLGFYDHRLNASGQRVHGHPHHSQQVKTQHGKSISGKLISVTGNSNSGTKGNDMSYQLSSSASIKEQRKHQQVLLQQQRQRK